MTIALNASFNLLLLSLASQYPQAMNIAEWLDQTFRPNNNITATYFIFVPLAIAATSQTLIGLIAWSLQTPPDFVKNLLVEPNNLMTWAGRKVYLSKMISFKLHMLLSIAALFYFVLGLSLSIFETAVGTVDMQNWGALTGITMVMDYFIVDFAPVVVAASVWVLRYRWVFLGQVELLIFGSRVARSMRGY